LGSVATKLQHDLGMSTKISIARKMDVSAAKAWEAISKFGRLDVWFPTIATCEVKGTGLGATRRMTLERGGSIIDRIIALDASNRRLIYDRAESPFPVSSYRGTVEVLESFDALAVVVWTVDFTSAPDVAEGVAAMLSKGIGNGVEGMNADLKRRD
jgi:hypothetical protein